MKFLRISEGICYTILEWISKRLASYLITVFQHVYVSFLVIFCRGLLPNMLQRSVDILKIFHIFHPLASIHIDVFMIIANHDFSEPQLLPQQSLTISEIHDDDDLKNLHHPDFEWSVNSSDSESQSSDSDGSSLHDSFQNCGKDLETERFISRKSVRYRLKDSCKFCIFL